MAMRGETEHRRARWHKGRGRFGEQERALPTACREYVPTEVCVCVCGGNINSSYFSYY